MTKTELHSQWEKLGEMQKNHLEKLYTIGKYMDKDFSLFCIKIDEYGKWKKFEDILYFPISHRLRLPYEIVYECDNVGRKWSISILSLIRNEILKKVKGKYVLYIEDHWGRSPHLHFIPTNRRQYRIGMKILRKYNVDKQINNGKHLVREIGSLYLKNFPNTTIASCFEDFKDIVEIREPNFVSFPEIDLSIFKPFPKKREKKIKEIQEKIQENLPQKKNINTEYSQIINSFIDELKSNGDLSHIRRVAVAIYLINCGYSDNEIKEVFKYAKDYNEKETEKQIFFIRKKGYKNFSLKKIKNI